MRKGKRSLDVQLTLSFTASCRRSLAIESRRLAASMDRQVGGDANIAEQMPYGGWLVSGGTGGVCRRLQTGSRSRGTARANLPDESTDAIGGTGCKDEKE